MKLGTEKVEGDRFRWKKRMETEGSKGKGGEKGGRIRMEVENRMG